MSGKRDTMIRYNINHKWTAVRGGEQDVHTCQRCELVVETPAGQSPTKAWARVVNGRPMVAKAALPSCTVLKGAQPVVEEARVYHTASKEWRDMLKACAEVCGAKRVRDYLQITGAGINDAQEVALVTLHAAVRVHLLEAHEELEMVDEWAREHRREELDGYAHSCGESRVDGGRQVPAAGGAR